MRTVEAAEDVRVYYCSNCGNPHLELLDGNGDVFAVTKLPPEAIRLINTAREIGERYDVHGSGKTGVH